jgi:hypothetical protein
MVVGEVLFSDGTRDARVWAEDDDGSVVDVGGVDRRAQIVLFGARVSLVDELKREMESYEPFERTTETSTGSQMVSALTAFVDDPLLFLNKAPKVKKMIDRVLRVCRFAMEEHAWIPSNEELDATECFDA